ncbi:MAG: hypothetical protein AAGI46_16900 [Planctomycetota bacterium]
MIDTPSDPIRDLKARRLGVVLALPAIAMFAAALYGSAAVLRPAQSDFNAQLAALLRGDAVWLVIALVTLVTSCIVRRRVIRVPLLLAATAAFSACVATSATTQLDHASGLYVIAAGFAAVTTVTFALTSLTRGPGLVDLPDA